MNSLWLFLPTQLCHLGSDGLWNKLSGMPVLKQRLIAVLLCGTKLNFRHRSFNFCFQVNNSTYDCQFICRLVCRAGLSSPRETGSLLSSSFISFSAKTMRKICSQSKKDLIQCSLISSIEFTLAWQSLQCIHCVFKFCLDVCLHQREN